MITNLADDLTLVARMQDALAGEMNRRQEVLRSAGNFANVKDYERARENGADLDPLPALFIVIDEFSELLTAQPEFIELFVAIGRLGRSLRMHLLLASQRLEEGRLRGLDSHLSYRIGLKTFSASESRAVLGVPDAYELPSVPGRDTSSVDTGSMVRFKASYVSGPYRAGGAVAAPVGTGDLRPQAATVRAGLRGPAGAAAPADSSQTPAPQPADPARPETPTEPSVLDIVVARCAGRDRPRTRCGFRRWTSRLAGPAAAAAVGHRGPWAVAGRVLRQRQAHVPVGIVDKPYEQRRDLLWADLSGAAGHAVVAGGPQSGKSSLLRTILMSLALTHTPEEVQFFGIDFGGGTLASLRRPAARAVGWPGGWSPDTVRRIVAEVSRAALGPGAAVPRSGHRLDGRLPGP